MKPSVVFKRLKRFDSGTSFEIDETNQSINYRNSLIFFESYLNLVRQDGVKQVLYEDIEYFLVDKMSLLQLQKAEFSNEKYHFSILLISGNDRIEIPVHSSNDFVVLSEIFRLYKIGIETQSGLSV